MKKDLDDYGIGRLLKKDEPGYEYLKDSKLIGKMLSAVIYDTKLDKKLTEGLGIVDNDSDTSEFNEDDYLVKEDEGKPELLDKNGDKLKFRGIDKYIVHRLNTTIFSEDQAKTKKEPKKEKTDDNDSNNGKYQMKPVLFREDDESDDEKIFK